MSAEELKEKKTDPKVRFAELRSDERKLLANIKDKEKEIKITLAQLQALRKLQAEVIDEIEIESYEETLKSEQEERDKKIEVLEELVADVKEEIEKKEGEQTLYTGINAQQITKAASEGSISKLYELAYKSNDWTKEESKEFFEIRDAVFQARSYDLAENLTQTIDNVYQAIQTVSNQAQEQISANYKPQYSTSPQFKQDLPPINQTQLSTENIQNYKNDKPIFEPTKNTFESNTLDSKLDKKKKLDF